ncbi:S46 family peptidase [Candidatus Parcubacteria bacterium]|nr:MAG: S46 family peptidase [Candidatus Parcubacteria bacterium]
MKEPLNGDEGMWLPNALPLERLKKLYGFTPSKKWAEHIQKASVRMNNGGSASFVSPNGLLVTNHHVAESILHDLSSAKKDYVNDGFYAKKDKNEVKAKELEINILWTIKDVTERIKAITRKYKNAKQASGAKRSEIARIEKESYEKTGLRSNVVTLYRGGLYHLYCYKKYTDVRLVFAPESAIAALGGDFDNYEFPRYCLDVSFFRVYENDKPLKTPYFFKWSDKPSKENEILFISGHPGNTERLSTLSRLKSLRDFQFPYLLDWMRRREILLQQFSGKSLENQRKAKHELHSIQNARKRFLGQLKALQDQKFIAQKELSEEDLRAKIRKSKPLRKNFGNAWDILEKAEEKLKSIRDELYLFENAFAFNCELFDIARTIVRLTAEDKKPNHKRLSEFRDSNRESLLHSLFSPAPIYKDLEVALFEDSLAFMTEIVGTEDSMVKQILSKKSPSETASQIISETKLNKVSARKRLVNSGMKGVMKSKDPMILLARLADKRSRAVRKVFETSIKEVREQAYSKIAEALFALYGSATYPDATFTLRFAYGRPKGYVDAGKKINFKTTIGETFNHANLHKNIEPWKLPESWLKNKNKLAKSKVIFNFVSTNEAHGGNSGSPIFDKDLNIVGLLFDGNAYDFANHFMYTDEKARSVSVHSQGILEVLKKVYKTERLIKELIQ